MPILRRSRITVNVTEDLDVKLSLRARYCLEYVVVRVFLCLVQSLRIETCERASRALAKLFWSVLKVRRPIVEANLRCAFPEMSDAKRHRLGRRMWEHLVLMICEIAHAPRKIHETNWRRYVTLPQRSMLVEALLDHIKDHEGVIFMTGDEILDWYRDEADKGAS